jgi:hypothetical protein
MSQGNGESGLADAMRPSEKASEEKSPEALHRTVARQFLAPRPASPYRWDFQVAVSQDRPAQAVAVQLVRMAAAFALQHPAVIVLARLADS